MADRHLPQDVISFPGLVQAGETCCIPIVEDQVLQAEALFSREIIDSAPGVFYLIDANGQFLRWNRNLELISGYDADDVRGMHPLEFFAESAQPAVAAAIQTVFAYGSADIETLIRTRDGQHIPFRLSARRIDFGGESCLIGFGIDISELKRTADELDRHRGHLERLVQERTAELQQVILQLAERKSFLRSLTDNLPCLVSYWGRDQHCLFANNSYLEWFGRTAEEITGLSLEATVGKDMYSVIRPNIEAVLRGESQIFCRTLTKPSGETGHMLVQQIPECLGSHVVGFFILLTDISAQRGAQLELEASHVQLRQLLERQDEVRDQERQHLSRELHDELGQVLTGMHFAIEALRMNGGADANTAASTLKSQLDQTMAIVRRITHDLRPAEFDQGLMPALEILASDFHAQTGIHCRLTVQGKLVPLGEAQTRTIFRIAQESLTNVARHAGTQSVAVHLCLEMERLRLMVQDTGRGFDPRLLEQADGLGLFGMKERAATLGATLKIDSQPGRGTRIELDMPYDTETRK